MRQHGLDPKLRQRLREYFHQTKHLRVTVANRHLLRQMSPQLQGEVSWRINERWLRRVWFFRGADQAFIIQMALHLAPMVFSPGELAPPDYLYIVHRGVALYGGKVLTSGKVWGEDMILSNSELQRRWCARAMSYLEVLMLSREQLTLITGQFPATARVIRRASILLALRRFLVARLQEFRSTQLAPVGAPCGRPLVRKTTALDTALVSASSEMMSAGEQTYNSLAIDTAMATSAGTAQGARQPATASHDGIDELREEMSALRKDVTDMKAMLQALVPPRDREGGKASVS